MLEKLVGTGKHIATSALDIKELPIQVYLSAPNLVNTFSGSSSGSGPVSLMFTGIVWRIYPKLQPRDGMLGRLKDKLLYSIDQHSLVAIVQALSPTDHTQDEVKEEEGQEEEADGKQGSMVWRRLVVRWPSICWTNMQGGFAGVASSAAAIMSAAAVMPASVVHFFFNLHKVGVRVSFIHALHNPSVCLTVARLLLPVTHPTYEKASC
jgi:hypothetical protein